MTLAQIRVLHIAQMNIEKSHYYVISAACCNNCVVTQLERRRAPGYENQAFINMMKCFVASLEEYDNTTRLASLTALSSQMGEPVE